ncbi:MAG: hypothetical protein SF029_16195 [bacterium]|nr:hypothetical protein [bacterium]
MSPEKISSKDRSRQRLVGFTLFALAALLFLRKGRPAAPPAADVAQRHQSFPDARADAARARLVIEADFDIALEEALRRTRDRDGE